MSPQWHGGDGNKASSSCSSIHLPPTPLILPKGASSALNIGKPAVPGVTRRQQGVQRATESPGLSSEQGSNGHWFINITIIIIFFFFFMLINMGWHCLKQLQDTTSADSIINNLTADTEILVLRQQKAVMFHLLFFILCRNPARKHSLVDHCIHLSTHPVPHTRTPTPTQHATYSVSK